MSPQFDDGGGLGHYGSGMDAVNMYGDPHRSAAALAANPAAAAAAAAGTHMGLMNHVGSHNAAAAMYAAQANHVASSNHVMGGGAVPDVHKRDKDLIYQ